MFGFKKKPLQVEVLTHPISVPVTIQVQPLTPQPPTEEETVNIGLALKLMTALFIFTQGALAVYGYAVLVGNYDYFGIDINELNISKATLLLYGYIYTLNTIFELGNTVPTGGAATLVMLCLLIATAVMVAVARRNSTEARAATLLTLFLSLIVICIAPAIGIQQGTKAGRSTLKDLFNGEPLEEYTTDDTIISAGQKYMGTIILADTQNSFLLVRNKLKKTATVYKIRNSDNSIIRTSTLREKIHTNKDDTATTIKKNNDISYEKSAASDAG